MTTNASEWMQSAVEHAASGNKGPASKWVKLKDGETVTIIFRGPKPVVYMKTFPAGQYKSEPETKPVEECNVYNLVDGAMQLLTLSPAHYKNTIMPALSEMGVDYVYKLRRVGADQTTKYLALPLRPATADELAAANACELHQLGGVPF